MNKQGEKIAFVFAGGGSLAAVQVGMLKAIHSSGTRADLVVGASAGAINGAYFAFNPTDDGIERLEEIWSGLRRNDIFPIGPLTGVLGLLARRDYLVETFSLRSLLEEHFSDVDLAETKVPCHVVATELIGGNEVRLSQGRVTEALLASIAIPALFPPMSINDKSLVDGGIANNTPISSAIELGATRLIVFPTGFSCSPEPPLRGPIAIALHALNLLISRKLVHDIEYFSRTVRITVVPPLCPMGVSPYDFSRGRDLIDRAFDLTRGWIDKGGLEATIVPGSLRGHSHPSVRVAA